MGNNNEKVDITLDNEEFYSKYGRKKTVGMFTLGCKVNQYETEALAGIFSKAGYEIVDFGEKADVYVINTCTVTSLSDRKSRQMIRRARAANNNAIVVVVGCYAQTAPEEVSGIPGVNLVIGTRERYRILDYIMEVAAGRGRLNVVKNIMGARDFEELKIDSYKERTRAFIKIQEGCSQFCSYCIIPYARGPIRSRQPEDVINEVRKLAEAGFKEIVLTGIHIASYGKDLKTTSLIDIIKRVHNNIEGVERIRLGSLEPTTVTKEFVEAASSLGRLCPHFHLSLQSGCDATLKRMNRKYTVDDYRKAVLLLREKIKDVSLSTDVMVGFPGETEEEFEQSCRFVEEIGFAKLHVFKYSPRKGTPAADFPGQVDPQIKEERSNRLLTLSDKMALDFNRKFVGRIFPVLFEQEAKDEKGYMEGLTPNYIRVLCKGNYSDRGEIRSVRLQEALEDYVLGAVEE